MKAHFFVVQCLAVLLATQSFAQDTSKTLTQTVEDALAAGYSALGAAAVHSIESCDQVYFASRSGEVCKTALDGKSDRRYVYREKIDGKTTESYFSTEDEAKTFITARLIAQGAHEANPGLSAQDAEAGRLQACRDFVAFYNTLHLGKASFVWDERHPCEGVLIDRLDQCEQTTYDLQPGAWDSQPSRVSFSSSMFGELGTASAIVRDAWMIFNTHYDLSKVGPILQELHALCGEKSQSPAEMSAIISGITARHSVPQASILANPSQDDSAAPSKTSSATERSTVQTSSSSGVTPL